MRISAFPLPMSTKNKINSVDLQIKANPQYYCPGAILILR